MKHPILHPGQNLGPHNGEAHYHAETLAFDLTSIFIQTMLLLTRSLTFLALELCDFAKMIAIGAVPQRSGYLSAFFGLVPSHGLHVPAGCL